MSCTIWSAMASISFSCGVRGVCVCWDRGVPVTDCARGVTVVVGFIYNSISGILLRTGCWYCLKSLLYDLGGEKTRGRRSSGHENSHQLRLDLQPILFEHFQQHMSINVLRYGKDFVAFKGSATNHSSSDSVGQTRGVHKKMGFTLIKATNLFAHRPFHTV